MKCSRCKREASAPYTRCDECRAWKRAYDATWRQERREAYNAAQRTKQARYRQKARERKLCTHCLTREASAGYRQCDVCRARSRASVKKYVAEHREEYNAYQRAVGKAKRAIEREIEQG